MNIIKTWKGKNALKNCEKEYKETIVVDAKKDIDHIDLVELNDDVLNAFIVYYADDKAA